MAVTQEQQPAAGAASVQQTMSTVNQELRTRGGVYADYSCKTVSWDDVERGTVGGGLSCLGANITDTRLWEKSGKQLFTVRSDNWNEKLGQVSADEVALVSGNQTAGGTLAPMTLRDFLRNIGREGTYAGLDGATNLCDEAMDAQVSIRFQTTFLPVADSELAALEFAPEMYNYQTRSDDDPRNLLILATTQGVAVQQDGAGAKKLFHHAVDPADAPGSVCRYWFEAERSKHKVGGAQTESQEEALEAAKRGKATAAVIGTRAMGTRFNVLLTVQVPLQQKSRPGRSSLLEFEDGSLLEDCCFSEDESGCEDDDLDEESCFMDSMVAPGAPPPPPGGPPPQPSTARRRCEAPVRRGTANAARVSRGTMVDRWGGLQVRTPTRDASQHVTVTAVIYNTVAGGVPSAEDVAAAIDDMEQLYAACGWTGRLADKGAAFMKKELTVADVQKIGAKLSEQPYVPPAGAVGLVAGGGAFPMSSPPPAA